MLGTLRDVLGGDRGSDVLYECRHCGTTVDPTVGECPACGRGTIARYEIG